MLTCAKIDRLKPEATTKRYTDRDGLTLEMRPSGKKVFIFRFQWEKKPQTLVLGHYPALSLGEARKTATMYHSLIANGVDPREKIREEKAAKIAFKDVAEQWYAKNCPKWRKKTQKQHRRSLDRDILPVIGSKPIGELTRANILRVIHPHESAQHHEIAHRIYSRIKVIFEFALAAGLTENFPMNGMLKALTPKPKVESQLAIHPDQAHEMLSAIEKRGAHKISKLYVKLLAHLLVRPSELRLACWSEFSFQNAEWHIPTERMKMDAPHWVPLSQPVLAMLRELRLLTGFTPYLFTSASVKQQNQPISDTSARKLINEAGYKGKHSLHGFRSLASTVLHSETHFRSDAIESQLAHKIQGVRGIYMRAEFKAERRELMEWYSNWISGSKLFRAYPLNYAE